MFSDFEIVGLEEVYLRIPHFTKAIVLGDKFNFSELNELWLHNNNIEDITPLKKFKTGKIEVLSLFGNKIDKDKFANTIQQMQENIY